MNKLTVLTLAGVLFGTAKPLTSYCQFRDLIRKTDSTIKALDPNDKHSIPAGGVPEPKTTQVPAPGAAKPSDEEMQGGIKQALQQALQNGIKKVSAPDGFFKDASIKLLFPPEARKAEKTLRSFGLGQVCDRVILQMNRAAEDASKKAAPVFLNALRHMSIQDAAAIVSGSPNAATDYFKSHTSAGLRASFKPVIDSSLKKLHATALYSQAISKYNAFPLAGAKLDPSLSDYATGKAIDGLFITLAGEEARLRANAGLNASPLIRKVFGYIGK